MIKILLIALVIYLLVVLRGRIRLPHPGLQATVDVLTAADLSDKEVQRMAAQYIRYSDAQSCVAAEDDPYAVRLAALTDRFVAVGTFEPKRTFRQRLHGPREQDRLSLGIDTEQEHDDLHSERHLRLLSFPSGHDRLLSRPPARHHLF